MADKYDEAIAELEGAKDFNRAVTSAWVDAGEKTTAGLLFQFCNKKNERGRQVAMSDNGNVVRIGCLTQIRDSPLHIAETETLTTAIRADEKLPNSTDGVRHEHLSLLADWQRRIDRELGRDFQPQGRAPRRPPSVGVTSSPLNGGRR
jgi:hypothetical protein